MEGSQLNEFSTPVGAFGRTRSQTRLLAEAFDALTQSILKELYTRVDDERTALVSDVMETAALLALHTTGEQKAAAQGLVNIAFQELRARPHEVVDAEARRLAREYERSGKLGKMTWRRWGTPEPSDAGFERYALTNALLRLRDFLPKDLDPYFNFDGPTAPWAVASPWFGYVHDRSRPSITNASQPR
jgi:hypothetical protein